MAETSIGKAYVQIVPTAKGITKDVEGLIGGDVEKSGESAGDSFAKKMVSTIKGVAVAAGIGKIFSDAINAGADLQQSYGGLETIYGDAADAAKAYAEEAYKAGISANDYAEQAVSFGASLKQAFEGDTARAVEAANTAIMDMTDNAAKMGTPIESIQNAYQGFAKQNYTMLDNLKLGYGGTKEEMERLLSDAQELSGVEYNIDNLGDVYDAIHVIQEDLGLTGVAAAEASETFSGSLDAMKAAASNLLAKLALGEDISLPLKELGDTVNTFVTGNLLPMIGNIVQQIPMILVHLPGMLTEMIPNIVPVMGELVTSLGNSIYEAIPDFAFSVMALFETIWDVLANIDWTAVGQFIADLINQGWFTLKELAASLWDFIVGIFTGEIDFPDLSGAASAVWNALCDVAAEIWDGIVYVFTQLITWPNISAGAKIVWDALTTVASDIWDAVVEFFTSEINWPDIATGAKAIWNNLVDIAGNIWDSIVDFFTSDIDWPDIAATAKAVWDGLVTAAEEIWNKIKEWFTKTFSFPSLDSFAKTAWSTLTGIASGIWEGIKAVFGALDITFADLSDVASKAWDTLTSAASGIWDGIKEIFGSFDIEWPDFGELASGALEGLKNAAESVWGWIKGLFSGDEDNEAVKSVQGSTSEMAAALADAELKISDVDVSSIQLANEYVEQTVLAWMRIFGGMKNWMILPTVKTESLASTAQVIASWVNVYKGKMNFSWNLPTLHGHLPVISVNMRQASSSDGKTKVDYPELSVSSFKWFAKGGIFRDPTIIGIGDSKSPEAAVPLDMMWKQLGKEFDEHMGHEATITNYFTINGADDPEESGRQIAREIQLQLRMA